jgi:hypothetical protein
MSWERVKYFCLSVFISIFLITGFFYVTGYFSKSPDITTISLVVGVLITCLSLSIRDIPDIELQTYSDDLPLPFQLTDKGGEALEGKQ